MFPNEVMNTSTWGDLEEMGNKRRKEKRERRLRTDYAVAGPLYGKVNR